MLDELSRSQRSDSDSDSERYAIKNKLEELGTDFTSIHDFGEDRGIEEEKKWSERVSELPSSQPAQSGER